MKQITEQDVARMLFIGCSDATVNLATVGVHDSLRYLNDYRWGMSSIVLLFIYIDYFGLLLCYGGTWRKISRKFKRWVYMPCRCIKKAKTKKIEK